jgi:hypothetical protein
MPHHVWAMLHLARQIEIYESAILSPVRQER